MRLLRIFSPVLAATLGGAGIDEVAADKRPNIVLVITDDQGYGPIGRHGNPWIRTPHLDRLFDRSTRFTRFLASPTCSPTRAALLTGRHPMRNGVTHTLGERERLRLDAVTLPQVLQAAGYQTGIFGKWHLGDEAAYQPGRRGFDEVFIHGAGGIGQAYPNSCADAPGNSYFDPYIRHNGRFVKTTGFCTDVFFAAALGWMHSAKDGDQPFFAYISTNAPHAPFHAPEEYLERFRELGFKKSPAGFYGMVENIDTNMGRLLAKLEAWQLLNDTVVIFMSDNGMAGGGGAAKGNAAIGHDADGRPLYGFNAAMRGLKGGPDEGGVRVPFFIRWDGTLPADQEIETIAAHIDVLPTLARLAGAELPPDQVEGRNLLPLIHDPQIEWPDRFLFTHRGRWPSQDEIEDFKYRQCAVRNQRFRFVNNEALYDMVLDPGQTTNVIDQHADVVAEMRAAYEAWWAETRPMMVNEGVPMSATRPYHVAFEEQQQAGGIPAWEPPEF